MGHHRGAFLLAMLVVLNALATVGIWRSRHLERFAKVIQTGLVWLLPGFFIVVQAMLKSRPPDIEGPS